MFKQEEKSFFFKGLWENSSLYHCNQCFSFYIAPTQCIHFHTRTSWWILFKSPFVNPDKFYLNFKVNLDYKKRISCRIGLSIRKFVICSLLSRSAQFAVLASINLYTLKVCQTFGQTVEPFFPYVRENMRIFISRIQWFIYLHLCVGHSDFEPSSWIWILPCLINHCQKLSHQLIYGFLSWF